MNSLKLVTLVAIYAQSVLGSYYHGPTTVPHVLQSGYLADTHEVAAAKGAHLAAHGKESQNHGYDNGHSHIYRGDFLSYDNGHVIKYHGPTAKPVVLKSGYLADTHEVAAAKGAHLAALVRESHNNGYDNGHSHIYRGDFLSYDNGHVIKYHGPTAKPVVLKSGYLADTHEVAAAKGAHLAALVRESHNSYGYGGDYSGSYGYEGDYSGSSGGDHSYSHGHDIRYHGPTTIPHVLKNGHIADTHEVAAAKAHHYAAVSKAKTHGGYGYAGDYGYGGSYGYSQGGHGAHHVHAHGHDIRYHGPTAIPHVLKNGHIADTHNVAAAKAAHYAAVNEAKSYGGHGHGYSLEYKPNY